MDLVIEKPSLYVEQMYTGCLAEAAYYLESDGEAVVIDPMRETAPYVKKAAARAATIKYVFETHFHADFVSGHVDLAKATGAQIVYGPTARPAFDAIEATDKQVFRFGQVSLEVLHTPGHTPESSCYLLQDENEQPVAVFTGDTLFIGEVGRPDLAVKSDLSQEDLAGMLYESLHQKLMTLPDEVIVYPGHGAGSACGKNISNERVSNIGQQKALNYALQPMPKETFIARVTEGIMPPPQYFPKNAVLNKMGYENIDELLLRNTRPLSPQEVSEAMSEGGLVIDTRSPEAFEKAFVPGSIFIGLDGSFASWVGTLIEDLAQPLVVVTEAGREEEAVLRLARVGYSNAVGYLAGGIEAWQADGREVDSVNTLSTAAFAEAFAKEALKVVDVRKPTEFAAEHVEGAISYPLDFLQQRANELPEDETHYLYCLGGYRSMIATSLLKREGYTELVNIAGGFRAIAETEVPRTDYVCPSTLK